MVCMTKSVMLLAGDIRQEIAGEVSNQISPFGGVIFRRHWKANFISRSKEGTPSALLKCLQKQLATVVKQITK